MPIPISIGSMLTVLWKYTLTLMNWYKVDIEKKGFIPLLRTPCGDKPYDDSQSYA
jgi:hypothetical protein